MKTVDFHTHLFMGVFVVPICVMVNRKLYINIKNEEHLEKGKVIQRIMKTYALLQCVCWPCIVAVTLMLHLLDVYYEIGRPPLVKNFLFGYRFFFILYRTYVGFNSLIIAVSRYTFVVFARQTEIVGISKVKAFLISCSLGIPVVTSILYEFTQPMEQEILSVFFHEAYNNKTNTNECLDESLLKDTYQSLVYSAVNKLLPPGLMYTMKLITDTLLVIIHSNILEGMLYYHISKILRRYGQLRSLWNHTMWIKFSTDEKYF